MDAPLISVVMIFFDAERFIDEAIRSVLEQDHPHIELVLVDDGSTDGSREIARECARTNPDRVRYVAHPGGGNRVMAASRALGVRSARGDLVAFLDADDRWDAHHLSGQWKVLAAHPEADMVCAPAHVWESWADPRCADPRNTIPFPDGAVVEPPALLTEILADGGHAVPICSMLVRRSLIERVGGPVVEFRTMFEDQAFQAKLFLAGTVVMSAAATAWYRQHPGSACARAIEAGHYDPNLPNVAYRRYLVWLRAHLEHVGVRDQALFDALAEAEAEYGARPKVLRSQVRWAVLRYGPPSFVRTLRAVRRRTKHRPFVGFVRFGSLRRTEPIDRSFGYDRGYPVDRYYIESFLDRHRADVRGHVLEIGEDAYTRRFGADVTKVDVLHVDPASTIATIVADLADAPHISDSSFDCLIVTQTLHLVYALEAAVRTMHRILRPGGVLLLTVPGISQQSDDEWGETWYWSLTRKSVRRLFGDVFGDDNVDIGSHGNVLAAVALLHGLSADELTDAERDHYDPAYEMIVTVRAVKREGPGAA
jgi:glycosyltransferase involved in cell wall biosynthesis